MAIDIELNEHVLHEGSLNTSIDSNSSHSLCLTSIQPLKTSPTLSDEYGRDDLVLLVRDPQWLFAYWDLSGGLMSCILR